MLTGFEKFEGVRGAPQKHVLAFKNKNCSYCDFLSHLYLIQLHSDIPTLNEMS